MSPTVRHFALVLAVAFVALVGPACAGGDGDDEASTSTGAGELTDAPTDGTVTGTAAPTTVRPAPTGPTIRVGSDARDYGDDPVLDLLWDRCADGEGKACDELYYSAPVDSRYEEFGLSCGDRPNVILCAELDEDPGPTSIP